MLMEGTGKYFWLLFLVFLIVYVAVKLSLAVLLKRAKEDAWRAYIPVYTTLVLVDLLRMDRKYFYFSLIPIINLYFLNKIIKELLKGFALNPDDSIWYVIFPMYNFPKLAFMKPHFVLNEYDLTEAFMETQNALYEKPNNQETQTEQNGEVTDSVFTNNLLEPDRSQTTYIKPEKEEPKEEAPAINPVKSGEPKVCPKCGAKLAPNAEVCFLCGTKL